MRYLLLLPLLLGLLLSAVLPAAAQDGDSAPLALDGLDPVLLLERQEVEGDPLLSIVHDGWLYRFSSDRTRRAFAEDPASHAVQLGGSCARMGPGVEGQPDLFAVYDARIYLFGTEQCLDAFLEHPDRYVLPSLDPLAAASGEAREARQLLEKGEESLSERPLRRLEGYHLVGVEERGGRSTPFELWLSLDGAVQRKRLVGGEIVVETWNGTRGSISGRAGTQSLPPWARRELLTETARLDALTLLRGVDWERLPARVEPPPEPGPTRWVRLELPSAARDPGPSEREQLVLEVDRHSGRVESLRYRGRGPAGRAGWITRRFSDFRQTGGLYLPFRREDTFEEDEEPFHVVTLESVDTQRVDARRFEVAEGEER